MPLSESLLAWFKNADTVSRFELAQSIAFIFNRYRLHCEQVLDLWTQHDNIAELGEHRHWQAELWRQVLSYMAQRGGARQHNAEPIGNPMNQWVEALEDSQHPHHNTICQRIHHVGFSAIHVVYGAPLPLQYQRAINALALVLPVHKWCWLPIVDTQMMAPWDNSLKNLYKDRLEQAPLRHDAIAPHARALHRLQLAWEGASYINNAQDGQTLMANASIYEEDHSLRLHHFATCEAEIMAVYHAIIRLQQEAQAKGQVLTWDDILIQTPLPENYGPKIQSLFAAQAAPIPVQWQGAGDLSSPLAVDFIEKILKAADGRWQSEGFRQLLMHPWVIESLGLEQAQHQLLTHWLTQSQWRLGRDAQYTPNVVDVDSHGFVAGRDRLLLGLMADAPTGTAHIASTVATAAEQGQLLELLLSLMDAFDELGKSLSQPKTVERWIESWTPPINHLSPLAQKLWSAMTRCIAQELIEDHTINIHNLEIDSALWRYLILKSLEQLVRQQRRAGASGRGHGINIHPFSVDRVLPAKAIFVIGVDEESYPLQSQIPLFDVTAEDKVRQYLNIPEERHERRLAILQSLKEASEYWWLSFVNHNDKGLEVSPSMVVEDMRVHLKKLGWLDHDSLCQRFLIQDRELATAINDGIKSKQGRALGSQTKAIESINTLSAQRLANLATLWTNREPSTINASTASPHKALTPISLLLFSRYTENPLRMFVQNTLGIYDRYTAKALDESPLSSVPPAIIAQVINARLRYKEGEDDNTRTLGLHPIRFVPHHALLQAEGLLPHGWLGQWLYQERIERCIDLLIQQGLCQSPSDFAYFSQRRFESNAESIIESTIDKPSQNQPFQPFQAFMPFHVADSFLIYDKPSAALSAAQSASSIPRAAPSVFALWIIRDASFSNDLWQAWLAHVFINTARPMPSLLMDLRNQKKSPMLHEFSRLDDEQAQHLWRDLQELGQQSQKRPLPFTPTLAEGLCQSFKKSEQRADKKNNIGPSAAQSVNGVEGLTENINNGDNETLTLARWHQGLKILSEGEAANVMQELWEVGFGIESVKEEAKALAKRYWLPLQQAFHKFHNFHKFSPSANSANNANSEETP